jgi:undecaprenyl-diphosphatase
MLLASLAAAALQSAPELTPFRAAVLGALQGLTEFLPISSSAHLFAVPALLGWKYEGLAFDVALHAGTLVALLLAYGRDWQGLVRDAFARAPTVRRDARRLWLWLIVATVPGAVAGKLLESEAETHLRALPLQAAMLVVFGLVLWAVDRARAPGRDERVPSWACAAWMGVAQALALVPGVSRSGITITAGRMSGLSRVSAARFSFLLATPITFGAVLLKLRDVPMDVPPGTLAVAVVTSALVGLLAIRGLIHWLGRAGFGVFFAYRAAFAALLLVHVLRG